MKKYILIIIAILWATLIFYASSKDYNESNHDSKYIIGAIIEKGSNLTNKLKITNINTSQANIDLIVSKLNKPIRKLTHFLIYFILGIILYYIFISFGLSKKSIILVFVICCIYSLTDEYHQSFSFGRTSSINDCIIDTLGAICGCTIELIIINIIKKYQLNKDKLLIKNIN